MGFWRLDLDLPCALYIITLVLPLTLFLEAPPSKGNIPEKKGIQKMGY